MTYKQVQRGLERREAEQARRDREEAERPPGTLRVCKECGEAKLWNYDFYSRKTVHRPDGSTYEGPWYTKCRACMAKRLKLVKEQRHFNKKRGIPDTPPLAKALGGMALPKIAPTQPHNFRQTLLNVVAPEWRSIAQQLVRLAKSGDKQAIRLVASYALGTPRELEDDSGAHSFWSTVLAAASQPGPRPDPDGASEESDLEAADGAGG